MSSKWRRFEVMLPLAFNDGRPVPDEWIGQAVRQIAEHFQGVAFETQAIKGIWIHKGRTYRDDLTRITSDVPDVPKSRRWMREFKAQWKARLDQLEVWLVSWRIEIE